MSIFKGSLKIQYGDFKMFNLGEFIYENNAKPIKLKKDRDKYKNDIYILKLWASNWDGHTRGFPSRDMAIRGNSDLDELANMITSAFDFDFDHLYDFSDTVKRNKKEEYGIAHEGNMTIGSSYTHNIIVAQVFKEKKKMLFLFDYGDMWHFMIKCIEIRNPKKGENIFPYAYNIKGEAPEQYPEYNKDEDEFD